MSMAPPGGQDRIMIRRPTAPISSSFAWQAASRWRSACRLGYSSYANLGGSTGGIGGVSSSRSEALPLWKEPRSAADAARPRRRSDRMKRRAFITPSLSKRRSRAKLRAELEQRDPERRAGLRRLALLWQINETL